MSIYEEALKLHAENLGKIEVVSKVKVESAMDLSLAYSPGVAEPCREIHKSKENIYKYTAKGNMVAVVSDGSAVLGLGNIGAHASLPVMEGKAILFKTFAGVDAFPICVDTQDPEKVIEIVKNIAVGFGAINLEDICAPNCFYIEEKLKKELDIPVFHDDQHGTAIVTLAALINAMKIVNKDIANIKIVLSGAGAAGIAITKLLLKYGAKNIILCDRKGIIEQDDKELDSSKRAIAKITNPNDLTGSLADALVGADVFIGVSAAGIVSQDMVRNMNKDAIVFPMANPTPEIMPEDAIAAGARIIGTGRSDYPNQVNNVLAFPGVLRGALDTWAKEINDEMKVAAAQTIASLVDEKDLKEDYVIPNPFDKRVAPSVAGAVAKAAIETRVARLDVDPTQVVQHTIEILGIKC